MGITMLVEMNNTRLKGKILIILDFRNDFFPTYLQLWVPSRLLIYFIASKIHPYILYLLIYVGMSLDNSF